MPFRERKYFKTDKYFTEICSQESNEQYPSIGSDNVLASSKRQAIIWTSYGYITDAYMGHSASLS